MRTEEFLDLYKRLESAIESRGLVDTTRYDNAIWGYMQSRAGAPYKDTLNLCREIRNLLSHNPKFEGEHIAEPSQKIIDELRSIIDKIENPLLAMDFAVKGRDIFCAEMDDSLLHVMQLMQKNRYTHVPVTDGGKLYGVLSENTVFTYMLMHTLISIDDMTPVSELEDYLPVDRHNSERYVFLPRTALYDELRAVFDTEYALEKRLAAVLITEHGKPAQKIIGLITPWDALGRPR